MAKIEEQAAQQNVTIEDDGAACTGSARIANPALALQYGQISTTLLASVPFTDPPLFYCEIRWEDRSLEPLVRDVKG
jgi:hypothetical protein